MQLLCGVSIASAWGCGDDGSKKVSDGGADQDGEIADNDGGIDTSCVRMRALRSWSAEPSAIAMLFTVETCEDGTPVPNLKPSDFVISEDDEKLSSEADPDFVPSRGRRVYITLLLDMSGSTKPVLGDLISGAKAFVSEMLVERDLNVAIGIEVFDGSPSTVQWQLPISDAERLSERLDELQGFVGQDVSSTNLNGAIVEALGDLQQRQQTVIAQNDNGVATQGYLVMFTDGADTSGTTSNEAAISAIANASNVTLGENALPPVDTYAVALAGADYDPDKLIALFSGTANGQNPLPPGPGGAGCSDTCEYAGDEVCDDGGPGASYSACEYGTDCSDCGPRIQDPSTGTYCDDTCAYIENGICDDGGPGAYTSLCSLGTDCYDCGERDGNSFGARNLGQVSLGLDEEAARRHVLEAANAEDLQQRFNDLATQIARQLEGTYLLAYCSPKRASLHTLTLDVGSHISTDTTPISYQFDATGFGGGCSAELFTSSCDNKGCGGFNCGACDDETETCDAATDQCVDSCVAQGYCGGQTITNALGYTQVCSPQPNVTQCGASCYDLQTDERNCGGCGQACPSGSLCIAGECTCEGGGTACGGGCFDLDTDENNCGACGNYCPSGIQCVDGVCDCGGGLIGCFGSCVNPNSDQYNCGGCGNQCPYDASCQAGACACSSVGLTACEGESYCVNTQTDSRNCGGCGNVCGAGGSCNSGTCVCSGDTMKCGESCIDVENDPNNCGGCNEKCAANQVCAAGSCQASAVAACTNGSVGGDLTTGTLTTTADESGYCYGSGQNYRTFSFRPPVTGYYTFEVDSTSPTPYELSIAIGNCQNDGWYTCGSSLASAELQAGTDVAIMVFSGAPIGTSFEIQVFYE